MQSGNIINVVYLPRNGRADLRDTITKHEPTPSNNKPSSLQRVYLQGRACVIENFMTVLF